MASCGVPDDLGSLPEQGEHVLRYMLQSKSAAMRKLAVSAECVQQQDAMIFGVSKDKTAWT
eukprot:3748346-Rhodomonas_salina.1